MDATGFKGVEVAIQQLRVPDESTVDAASVTAFYEKMAVCESVADRLGYI